MIRPERAFAVELDDDPPVFIEERGKSLPAVEIRPYRAGDGKVPGHGLTIAVNGTVKAYGGLIEANGRIWAFAHSDPEFAISSGAAAR
jgi:hypothetical protein